MWVFTFKGGTSHRYKLDRKRWLMTQKDQLVLQVKPGKQTT